MTHADALRRIVDLIAQAEWSEDDVDQAEKLAAIALDALEGKTKKVYRAVMETRSWTFDAVGETRKQARDALLAGLRAHAKQYGLPPQPGRLPYPRPDDWYWVDDIYITAMETGVAYRDHEELPR